MMGTKEKLTEDELVAFTGLKHVYRSYEKPGVTKKIKRLFNRRIRHKLNSEINQDIVE